MSFAFNSSSDSYLNEEFRNNNSFVLYHFKDECITTPSIDVIATVALRPVLNDVVISFYDC